MPPRPQGRRPEPENNGVSEYSHGLTDIIISNNYNHDNLKSRAYIEGLFSHVKQATFFSFLKIPSKPLLLLLLSAAYFHRFV